MYILILSFPYTLIHTHIYFKDIYFLNTYTSLNNDRFFVNASKKLPSGEDDNK